MAMWFWGCAALVASPTLGAIWVGCGGPHWPTQCSIVVGNAFLVVRVWHLPYLEMGLPNLEMAMGAARCGALATLVAMGTLGAIWVGATRCQWPTKCDTSIQFAIFCHGQTAIFLPKKWNKLVVASPRPCGCWGWLVGTPAPNLACPMPWGAAKNEGVLVVLSLKLL